MNTFLHGFLAAFCFIVIFYIVKFIFIEATSHYKESKESENMRKQRNIKRMDSAINLIEQTYVEVRQIKDHLTDISRLTQETNYKICKKPKR